MAKVVAFISTASLICLLIFLILYQKFSRDRAVRQTLDSPAIVKEVQQMNELVTVRFGIQRVVGMQEDKSPVGSESILLLVQGNVLAGVDLSQLKPGDITFSKGNNVHIRLVLPHIQEAFLDEKYTKVWDRSITWWTPWVTPDIDLEHKARMKALEDIRAAALQMGILSEARRNAEMDIRNILEALGIAKVDFYYGT